MSRARTPLVLAATALLLLVSVPEARSAATYRVPATIDSTGATDVTAPLLAFFVQVPDGSTIAFPAGGRYRIEGTLALENRHDLAFEGNGAQFFATTQGNRTRSMWRLDFGSGLTFRDIVVKGANPKAGTGPGAYVSTLEAQHGFDVEGTDGVHLQGVTVTDPYGDFVNIDKQKRIWAQNVTVRDSTFARSGCQGMAITGARSVVSEHKNISDVARSTFDVEPDGA